MFFSICGSVCTAHLHGTRYVPVAVHAHGAAHVHKLACSGPSDANYSCRLESTAPLVHGPEGSQQDPLVCNPSTARKHKPRTA